MSNKVIRGKNKRNGDKNKFGWEDIQWILQIGTSVYVILMLCIYPLYYQDKYFNMGEAKYFFFKNISLVFLTLLLILSVVGLFQKYFLGVKDTEQKMTDEGWKTWINNLSTLDWFVIAYAIAVWISFLTSSYQEDAIWGYSGWYMGIVSQMIFVLTYFFVSRCLPLRRWMLHGICAVSAIVFFLAVLHRFQIDPLQMYEGLSMDNKVLFLTTMGQATWYSSYLCIVFPIGVYLYWSSEKRVQRILYGMYVALGFASMVTQNSDSAFVAFGFVMLVLFMGSFKSNGKMMRFLEVGIIGLTAICGIGLLQICFPEVVVPLENLSIEASQGNLTKGLLGILLGLYLIFRLLHKRNKIQVVRLRRWGYAAAGVVILGILSLVLCIYLNAKGELPGFLAPLQQLEYFNFNDDWGNGRGFTWRCAGEIFQEYSLKNKLFGCGPDCFASYAYDRYADTLSSRWGNHVLTNAHNEWFTSLLFFGIAGFVTYLGIFVTSIASFGRRTLQSPFLLAVIMSVVAYFGHNFFCYQQVICTPTIFILIGMGEGLCRKMKLGINKDEMIMENT